MPLNDELRELEFASFPQIYDKFRTLSEKYGGMPADSIISAFTRTIGGNYARNNPYIQNRRVKQVSSLPQDYTKDKVAEMITDAGNNELPLRQVAHSLEYTAYPFFHTRKAYQELLTYHSYIAPQYVGAGEMKKESFMREWRLLEKLREEFSPAENAHRIAGQVLLEGKVFYVPRYSVDKPHNKVNYAFMQQLPSDWTKIVGYNSRSRYTVAFDMMYFMQPGTDPTQFGDLFTPYLDVFGQVAESETPRGTGTRFIYASGAGVDVQKFNVLRTAAKNGLNGSPEVYCQNGRWFYWVTLPIDRVFTFEADDVSINAVSPFTGLFLSFIQLAAYEQIQLELVQNPLISIITGEIPYTDSKDTTTADPYKLSNAGRKLFEALWYQMLAENNTSGIGLYMAPLQNMTLHQLSEAPGAAEISTNGYSYAMAKAGLSAIIPTTNDPKVGISQISLQIESKFAANVYKDFARMMKVIFSQLGLNYAWKFVMFGDIATDKDLEESCRKGMTLGILPDTLIYNALHDRSILDDICISAAIEQSGLLDRRIPLVSSYSAKQEGSGLPPQSKQELDPGGRPSDGGTPQSEGREAQIDIYGE